MNFSLSILSAAALAVLVCFACRNDAPASPAESAVKPVDTLRLKPVPTEGARTFEVYEGVVHWEGKKTLGERHVGTIQVSGGQLLVNQGTLLSGQVTLDMGSLAVSDLKDPGERAEFESHLRGPDFFDVKNFPAAEFRFTETLPSKTPAFNAVVTGELTMKGKTNPVNIPVRLEIDGDELRAESPAFILNRTQWGVSFRSGVLGTAKDKMIDDSVPLSLKIRAKAK